MRALLRLSSGSRERYRYDVDALRLPVIGAPGPRTLEAAELGLKPAGLARAQGLFDRYGRSHGYLRISVIEKCNLRCRYCMPEEGVPALAKGELLSFEEIERLAALFVKLGVRKIRMTGGEPLVRRDIDELVRKLGALKKHGLQTLAMTSNALLLKQHIPALLAAGMDRLNLSLDTLKPDRFKAITLREGCEETIEAIHAAADAGFAKIKVNAVVMAGVNEDELVDLARAFARERPIEVRYIEYMPFEGNHWGRDLRMVPAAAIRDRLAQQLDLHPLGLDETARVYAVSEGGKQWPGRLGIISSMSEPFCGTCNRTRLTADGHFRWCLLDEGEVDLRGPLRAGASDDDLTGLIEAGLSRKKPGHAPADELIATQALGGRSMIRIGG
jgi:cyclic pyranopterin phosphate synthase